MSIYKISDIVKYALPLAFTSITISNVFHKSGIWPYNPNIFTDKEFAPFFVTDRPQQENQLSVANPNNEPGPSGIQ